MVAKLKNISFEFYFQLIKILYSDIINLFIFMIIKFD